MAGRVEVQVSGVLEFLSAAELSRCLPPVTGIAVSAYLDTNAAVGAYSFVCTYGAHASQCKWSKGQECLRWRVSLWLSLLSWNILIHLPTFGLREALMDF
jgi:hypothetical protein